jgi:RNA polymerase sigma-70 factor (ECF subfamily)
MSDPQTLSDQELLRLTQAGDASAFTVLYGRHQGPIYRFALQMSSNQNVAEDVTQEVFLVLMREALSFDASRGSLSAYLYGIARNQIRRSLERNRLLVPLADEAEDNFSLVDPLIAPDDPLGDLTRSEGIAALRQAILALPLHYREVVVLCDLEEMSYAEVAEALDCALGTIRSRLHRAHALLVERLRAGSEKQPEPKSGKVSRCFA